MSWAIKKTLRKEVKKIEKHSTLQIPHWTSQTDKEYKIVFSVCTRYYLPTPLLGQDMTQGQFLSGV